MSKEKNEKVWEFVRQIQYGKQDLMEDPQCEKEYKPFVVNKALSYSTDCVMFANEMNKRHHLDHKLQFHYLLTTIRSYKRPYQKWVKPEVNDHLTYIKRLFECSDTKAIEIYKTLTPEQLELVKSKTEKGGRVSKNTK